MHIVDRPTPLSDDERISDEERIRNVTEGLREAQLQRWRIQEKRGWLGGVLDRISDFMQRP
jgi:hypothetical protein